MFTNRTFRTLLVLSAVWFICAIGVVTTVQAQKPGDKVEYKAQNWPEKWEVGTFVKELPGGKQVLIRERPNEFFAEGFERAYALTTEPRLGRYNIYAYGAGTNRLFLGHFELLQGGKYRVSRRLEGAYYGEGTYSFNSQTSTVEWLSGPYKEEGWGGAFTVEREGKTHRIELKKRTIAFNSID